MQKNFRSGGILWGIYYTIWRGSLAINGLIQTQIYRRALRSCGMHTVFKGNVYINYPKSIRVGDHCVIGYGANLTSELSTGECLIEDHVQISDQVKIDFTGRLTIEKNTLISSHARIWTHDHGYEPRSQPNGHELIIEENVWIGFGTVVLPRVLKIGRGAIIGAGSVVTKPVPAWAVLAGNPAIVTSYRRADYQGE